MWGAGGRGSWRPGTRGVARPPPWLWDLQGGRNGPPPNISSAKSSPRPPCTRAKPPPPRRACPPPPSPRGSQAGATFRCLGADTPARGGGPSWRGTGFQGHPGDSWLPPGSGRGSERGRAPGRSPGTAASLRAPAGSLRTSLCALVPTTPPPPPPPTGSALTTGWPGMCDGRGMTPFRFALGARCSLTTHPFDMKDW